MSSSLQNHVKNWLAAERLAATTPSGIESASVAWAAVRGASWLIVLVLYLCNVSGLAQTTNGQVNGTVVDPSGAVVPDAQVDVLNQTTNQHRGATTGSSGSYNVPQLAPGLYTVKVSKVGFGDQSKTGLNLEVNQNATVDFTFSVTETATSISVNTAPPLLNETDATLGDVVEHKQVVDLPLNGRSFTQLTLLTPGASPQGSSQQRAFTVTEGSAGVSPAVNGQRGQQNNYTMDGTLNNSLYFNTWAIDPPPDALREFNVQSHITDAQFAVSSGANINLVTASGGKQYHGTLWEFIRNDALDATQDSPGQSSADQPKLPYRQNQYGLVLSGPIPLLKNSTWFSGYWQGFRSVQSLPTFSDVPTLEQLGENGANAGRFLDFSAELGAQATDDRGALQFDTLGRPVFAGEIYDPQTQRTNINGLIVRDPFPGNLIPIARLNTASLAMIQHYYPAPNVAGRLPGQGGNLSFAGSNRTSSDKTGIRIDHRFRNNDLLFGRYNRGNLNRITPETLPTYSATAYNYGQQIAIGYTHLFGQSIVLDLRYGYTNTNAALLDAPAGATLRSATNFAATFPVRNGIELGPATQIQSYAGVQQNYLPLGPQNNHDGHADVSIVKGKHTIGMGALLYHVHSFDDGYSANVGFQNTATSFDGGSGPSGNGAASFLIGIPYNYGALLGDTAADVSTFWKGGYIQDQWKATNRLTLTAGLRYDYVPPPVYTNVVSGINIFTGEFTVTQPAPGYPSRTGEKNFLTPQYNGLEPRFGLAYKANDRTVLRSAIAILDDHNNTLVQEAQDLRVSWPRAQGVSLNHLDSTPGTLPRYTFGDLPTSDSFFAGLKPFIAYNVYPKNKIPYSMEFNLGVEQQLTNHLALSVDYVGSQSRHQFVQGNANTAPTPGAGAISSRVPYPQFSQFSYDLNSGVANYNALQVKARQSTSHGLTFLAAYTWSKSLDEESEGQAGSITNLLNLRQDYGPSDFDRRHIIVLSPVYELPFGRGREHLATVGRMQDLLAGGWNASTIFTYYSGAPFNIGINDPSNTGAQAGRPNRVPGVNPYVRSGLQFLNPAAFVTPSTYTFGTERRNDLTGPRTVNLDFSLFKDFHITERLNFQFRSEFFNVLNHPNNAGPSVNLFNTADFGVLRSAGAPREIQFAGKVSF